MKKNTILFLISCITILLFGLVSCNPQPKKTVALTISAAAVYRQVLPKIDQLYKQAKPNVAITYNFGTSVRSKKVKIAAIAPESSFPPAVSPVAVLKICKNITEVQEYIQFLKSDIAKNILEKYGFTMIP